LQISGASFGTPMVMSANRIDQFRPLLAIMVKTLPHSDQKILSMLIDGANAAVHWRVKIFSRITGTSVLTALMDMIEVRDGRIQSFTELFAPARAASQPTLASIGGVGAPQNPLLGRNGRPRAPGGRIASMRWC
jgi:SnoaL-like domain